MTCGHLPACREAGVRVSCGTGRPVRTEVLPAWAAGTGTAGTCSLALCPVWGFLPACARNAVRWAPPQTLRASRPRARPGRLWAGRAGPPLLTDCHSPSATAQSWGARHSHTPLSPRDGRQNGRECRLGSVYGDTACGTWWCRQCQHLRMAEEPPNARRPWGRGRGRAVLSVVWSYTRALSTKSRINAFTGEPGCSAAG